MEQKPEGKAKVDNLSYLVNRHFPREEILLRVVNSKNLEQKGVLLWALFQYHNRTCGMAFVIDSITRPFKIFYVYDSKRRRKYYDRVDMAWAEKYYRDRNFIELL